MAPIAATVALSHVEGVSDSARARELYKYYQPNAPVNQDTCIVAPSTTPLPSPPVDAPQESNPESSINIQSNVTSSKISSPDTALTAFCQLLTWRLGKQRAMISLIDAETQYFIAEGTKTVDLKDSTKHDPGDEIWMGCSSVTKAGRLCERTLEVAPTAEGDYPCFIVDDLSQDERFNTLSFVSKTPFLRFYAGVPLITKRGIPIGSLFVVDDQVGQGLSKEKIHFMGQLAQCIMKHLEMGREVEQHRRGMKMSRGLASFVEGRYELIEDEIEAETGEGTKIAGQFETEMTITRTTSKDSTRGSLDSAVMGATSSTERKEKEYAAALSKTEKSIMESSEHVSQKTRPDLESMSQPASFDSLGAPSTGAPSPHNVNEKFAASPGEESEATSLRSLFSRAANLIREAFEVDGGAIFYDAQTGFSSDMYQKSDAISRRQDNLVDPLAESNISSGEQILTGEGQSSALDEEKTTPTASPSMLPISDSPGLEDRRFSQTSADSNRLVEILGFSTADAASIHDDPQPGPDVFTPFEEKALQALLRRYPRGKLWTFDSEGAVSSSEEEKFENFAKESPEYAKDRRRRKLRSNKAKSDARYLSRHFPGVRQLLFVPLWDAGKARWLSGCFTWSIDPTRILSKQNELSFLTAFGNSVMAEWARIDTEIADQKKGDFIGSISHELRSPLHGILASAEFLEEVTTGWERQLVETIDSCGRTLLDTINHILDFSKINHFEKNWKRSKKAANRPSPGGPLSLRQSDLPMLNLFQEVDVSIICEEVVESVFAGHTFQNVTAQSFDQVAESRGKMSDNRRAILTSEQMMGPQQLQHAGVAVILDIAPQNFNFTTQPGALRRLIMNLLGNALKYTTHGFVKISLKCSDMEDFNTTSISGSSEHIPRSMVTLIVTDTGKGISAEFLRSKLFMPFAQENSLSSGTGLGLSIVRKIVSLLEGEIKFDSEVGRGTQVKVTLPLLREMPKSSDGSGNTTKSLISLSRESDQSVIDLRARVIGQKVALHGFDIDSKDTILCEMGQNLKASVTQFLVNWYGMKVVPPGQKSNLIVSNEADPSILSKLVHQTVAIHKNRPSIIILCSQNFPFDRSLTFPDTKCNVGYVAKPIGPIKLAKAIMQVMDGSPSLPTPIIEVPPPESSDLSNVFEELSLGRRGGEVLDNSRMAADSENARKAIESPTPNASIEKHTEFPFPSSPTPGDPKIAPIKAEVSAELKLTSPSRIPQTKSPQTASATSQAPIALAKSPEIKPTLLLVDDNAINIRLLSTYFKKRAFENIHEAQNGLEAVQKFESCLQGYDIVFMDITMPVLDGFGATKQIRAIEQRRREKPGAEDKAALIIAFTGRSSIEDQTEAVRVGIDLFMTKPVAFKEVGKIVDNWVANRGRDEDRSIVTSPAAAASSSVGTAGSAGLG